jgi:hypothetical protein
MSNDARLVKIIAGIAVFLEFTDEESLDPDVAMEMLEGIAAELQQLGDNERADVANAFNEVSKEYSGEQAAYIKDLPEAFGLI